MVHDVLVALAWTGNSAIVPNKVQMTLSKNMTDCLSWQKPCRRLQETRLLHLCFDWVFRGKSFANFQLTRILSGFVAKLGCVWGCFVKSNEMQFAWRLQCGWDDKSKYS